MFNIFWDRTCVVVLAISLYHDQSNWFLSFPRSLFIFSNFLFIQCSLNNTKKGSSDICRLSCSKMELIGIFLGRPVQGCIFSSYQEKRTTEKVKKNQRKQPAGRPTDWSFMARASIRTMICRSNEIVCDFPFQRMRNVCEFSQQRSTTYVTKRE